MLKPPVVFKKSQMKRIYGDKGKKLDGMAIESDRDNGKRNRGGNSARAGSSSKAKGLGLLSGLGTIQVDETNLAQLEKINSTLQTLIKQEATKPKKMTRTRSGSGVKR